MMIMMMIFFMIFSYGCVARGRSFGSHLVEAPLKEVDIVEIVQLDRKLNRGLELTHTHPLLGSPTN